MSQKVKSNGVTTTNKELVESNRILSIYTIRARIARNRLYEFLYAFAPNHWAFTKGGMRVFFHNSGEAEGCISNAKKYGLEKLRNEPLPELRNPKDPT